MALGHGPAVALVVPLLRGAELDELLVRQVRGQDVMLFRCPHCKRLAEAVAGEVTDGMMRRCDLCGAEVVIRVLTPMEHAEMESRDAEG